jgi:hypothetical protein
VQSIPRRVAGVDYCKLTILISVDVDQQTWVEHGEEGSEWLEGRVWSKV